MIKRCWYFAVVFLLAGFASSAFSQSASTSLRGVIKDPSGAVVPGATISVSSAATGFKTAATSNGAGEYAFPQIPPATYAITVAATGFGNQTKSAELLVNQPATIDFTLTVQQSNVIVNVSGEAQTLNTTDASLGNAVNNALIQALPSETRNVPDLLSLQPGVLFLPAPTNPTTLQDSRSGAVNGGRSDQGNITVDGIDDNDQANGTAFTGVLRETQDSVEEFRVTTGNSNADSGRSSGAQVSMVTKSGTNQFHGAAYEYYRPTFTVANDWFNKQGELNSGLPNIPGKLIRNIFGAAVGGPIKKDKLFFFGNYEGSRLAENSQVTQTTPTAAYQQGILTYQNASGGYSTLSSTDVAALDAGCQVCGTSTYPYGPGPDPAALKYFNALPTANGAVEGDGVNEGSYSFSSPAPVRLNTSIGRIDYIPTEKHRIFARGNFQKDITDGTEQFPGQGAALVLEDNTKGVTGGDTWTISPTMVNDIRYGYIRQGYGNRGLQNQDYTDFRFLTDLTAETPTRIVSTPVNNIVDNLTWTKGKHSFQVGGNWRLVHQNFETNNSSFNGGTSNPYWLGGTAPGPADLNQGFGNSYLIAYANLVGDIPDVTDNYNYHIDSPTSASLLPDGAFLSKRFKANEYEYYVQDTWHPTEKLTLTFGIRHSLLQTPYETTGQQIAPTIDTHAWYLERETAALQGQSNQPDLSFAPSGPFYNKPGYWPKSKNNIAPRFAVAYAPNAKTSIRLGAGIYYDHYGEGLVNDFAQNGSFGLSSSITNPASVYNSETAPRFTSRTVLPFNNGAAPSTESFPYTPAEGNALITTGLDSRIKTPYSESFDFSVQRELPGGFTLEVAYVGRMGRHLLQNLDLAEPTDYVDPQGGGDYYSAGSQLYKSVDANGGYNSNATPGCNCNQYAQVSPIPYFEHLFPWMANFDYQGESATQAIYTDEWSPSRANLGATTALIDLDFYCYSSYIQEPYPCPSGFQSRFWQNQFASLFSLSSIGMSYYNAGQVTLRHPSSHGLQMDLSYTLSKSIDFGSDTEKNNFGNSLAATPTGVLFSIISNTWKPQLNRGVSDFDTRHLVTLDYVYQLPVGRGKSWLGGANGITNAFLGGWQLSGILRGTSGLPFGLVEPGYTTNWTFGSNAVVTGPVKLRRHFDSNGSPQFFDNPDALNNGVATGSPVRLPYPGEAGERNFFRGDGYFDLDSGLSKTWSLREYGALKFAWEVYNVTNTVRFDPSFIGSQLTDGNLGIASALLTQPRRMQFSLRYDF